MQDHKQDPVLYEGGFQLPVPAQYWEMMENTNIIFMFAKETNAIPELFVAMLRVFSPVSTGPCDQPIIHPAMLTHQG